MIPSSPRGEPGNGKHAEKQSDEKAFAAKPQAVSRRIGPANPWHTEPRFESTKLSETRNVGSRYEASGSQSEFQPGSDGQVLRNFLEITSPEEMDEVELELLDQLYESIFRIDFPDRRLTVADLESWHYQWLGNVYPWAGELRNVNLSKGDFHFAAADQVRRLLDEFQQACLARFTPCHGSSEEALSEALAISHVELILIHPFREGNGRLARLLADVMAVQANWGLLDYSEWDRDKERYFAAIQQGLDRNYGPMASLMTEALKD